jgi:SAM-dependent methyltransferase
VNGVSNRLMEVLVCPACQSRLVRTAVRTGAEALRCERCGRETKVANGIPRFVNDADLEHAGQENAARRTQESFGYEWTHFGDWRHSGETNFNDYFEGLSLDSLNDRKVLDAGCGMGRHARQVAQHAGHVVAVDFSRAIDQAARNMADVPNVDCIQADLLALPVADGTFDFVYSLGVLHHLAQTEKALAQLVGKLKPGGRLRVYLYWKRHGWQGALLSLVTAARRVTTRLPFGMLRVFCWMLSVVLYGSVILPFRGLSALGVRIHQQWPLFVYSKYPFTILYNDQFDRFSAPLEKRYDAEEVRKLLDGAGLRDVQVRPCFGWLGDGTKH